MLTGSTTFFFDFDILAEGMTSTSSPWRRAARPIRHLHILGEVVDRAVLLIAGDVDRVRHHALGEERIEGFDAQLSGRCPVMCIARAKKRE
jgi:hypothetical protein